MIRIGAVLLLFAAPTLAAQNPADSGNARHHVRSYAEGRQRGGARMRAMLGLTDEQATKLQATESRFAQQRRDNLVRRRAIAESLRDQLRPGIAANADSVRKLLDAGDQNRDGFVRLVRDEEKEMAGYLTPVQRARYALMQERLRQRFAGMRGRHGRARGRRDGRWGGA
jgi:hypothetical protein